MNVKVALQFEDLLFAAKALWLIRFSLNEIPSSGFDSSFTLLSIASSPIQVISGTNLHNSSKYTTMIHAQLFQRPFNNFKSIPCRCYQCCLEYFHLYKTHLQLGRLLYGVSRKNVAEMYALLVPSKICQTYALMRKRHLKQK